MSIPALGIISLIAVNFKDIQKIIGMIGGFTVVILSFIFPALIYVKTNNYPRWHWKNVGSIFLLCFTVCCGFTAGFKALISLFISPNK